MDTQATETTEQASEPAPAPESTAAAAPGGNSLLDAATKPDAASDVAAPDEATPDNPDWFRADKYKTVEEQAKAYNELSKKFGAFEGAPETYELTLPEGIQGISVDDLKVDPRVEHVLGVAKELNMNQAGFEKMVHAFVTADAQMAQVNQDREMAQLGADAVDRINNIATFYSNQYDEADFDLVRGIASTADGVAFLERNMQKLRASATIPTNPGAAPTKPNGDTLRNTVDYERMAKDPDYRRHVDRMYRETYG